MGKIKRPIPVVEVIPHKPPMVLLDTVIAHDSRSTVCEVRLTPRTLFLENGRVAAWIGLEYMAQAVAAHAGMVSRRSGKPPDIGFWIGTRQADFYTDAYRLGQRLHVTVRHVWGEGELFSFDCVIQDKRYKRSLAKAQLNVFRPRDVARMFKKGKL